MKHILLTALGKSISGVSRVTKKGNGSTWPGHIALKLHTQFVKDILEHTKTKIIFVIGTNGKTTTSKILTTILKEKGNSVIQNTSGANLLNGIASTLLLNTNFIGKITADYAVFEIDENNVPIVLHEITPDIIIVLNLFRDQLDRYGELDTIVKKWTTHFTHLPKTTTLILNGDDPLVTYLGKETDTKVIYFGLDNQTKTKLSHTADSLYCPVCNHRLHFKTVTYSHLGNWICPHCGFNRPHVNSFSPSYPLPGTYNKYNTHAAVEAAHILHISDPDIQKGLSKVTPAFGRQEDITIKGKKLKIFLSKNPTSMNESLQTMLDLKGKSVMFLLNDKIPDGRDVSWIWDIDIEEYIHHFTHIFVGGERCYDFALRLQYAQERQKISFLIHEDIKELLTQALNSITENETLYVLPTYSAMLSLRQIVTGKKIL